MRKGLEKDPRQRDGPQPSPWRRWLHSSGVAGSHEALSRLPWASPGCDQRGPATRQHTALCPDQGMTLGGSGRGHHSFCPSPVLQAFATEGSQRSESGLCWVPDGDESPSKIGRPQQVRATRAPWSRVPVRGGGMEGEHLGPPQGWVRNLFTSISRYMRPFFFLFTIIVTLVNPSMNRQSRLQRDRVRMGWERRHLCICSAAPAGQTAWLPAGMGEEPFPRGASPLRGCGGLVICTWGGAAAGPSGRLAEAEAEVGDTGTALGASLATRTASLLPATQEGSRPGRETLS